MSRVAVASVIAASPPEGMILTHRHQKTKRTPPSEQRPIIRFSVASPHGCPVGTCVTLKAVPAWTFGPGARHPCA